MPHQKSKLGLIGLGPVGTTLTQRLAELGFTIATLEHNPERATLPPPAARHRHVHPLEDLGQFRTALHRPRVILLALSAGQAVDDLLAQLVPLLERGDVVVDLGNSHPTDTDRRQTQLARDGIHLLGVGLCSGGHSFAAGFSLMAGGDATAYELVRPAFEAMAAKVDDRPGVSWLGPGPVGHVVLMVHNGIEYGLMQLLAESYDLLKRGAGLDDDELHHVFTHWNNSELHSFLLEITGRIFVHMDERTGERVIDLILDIARQPAAGLWTPQAALAQQVPVPGIEAAVWARNMSRLEQERKFASELLGGPAPRFARRNGEFTEQLRHALYAGMVITFAQGMELLSAIASEGDDELSLAEVARVWRGGCIISGRVLEKIQAAYEHQPTLPNLLIHPSLAVEVVRRQAALRQIVAKAVAHGLPVPGFMAALAYYDSYRSAWLPANLIQAQRDYFGGHKYERVDESGAFHTAWQEVEAGETISHRE